MTLDVGPHSRTYLRAGIYLVIDVGNEAGMKLFNILGHIVAKTLNERIHGNQKRKNVCVVDPTGLQWL